jgi:hypothetical protein
MQITGGLCSYSVIALLLRSTKQRKPQVGAGLRTFVLFGDVRRVPGTAQLHKLTHKALLVDARMMPRPPAGRPLAHDDSTNRVCLPESES